MLAKEPAAFLEQRRKKLGWDGRQEPKRQGSVSEKKAEQNAELLRWSSCSQAEGPPERAKPLSVFQLAGSRHGTMSHLRGTQERRQLPSPQYLKRQTQSKHIKGLRIMSREHALESSGQAVNRVCKVPSEAVWLRVSVHRVLSCSLCASFP